MKSNYQKKSVIIFVILLAISNFSFAQTSARGSKSSAKIVRRVSQIEERNVRAEMNFLASDAMHGRGSGTQFELLAGKYIASQLQQFGVEPAGETDTSGNKTYIQTVNITRNSFAVNPTLTYSANGKIVTLEHGKEMLVARMNTARINGQLQKMTLDEQPKTGSIVFVKLRATDDATKVMQNAQKILASGAAAVIFEEFPMMRAQWENIAARKISFTNISSNPAKKVAPSNIIIVGKDAANALAQVADGTNIEIKGQLAEPQTQQTYNAVGKLTGSDSRLAPEVILLSAHMDHLGVRANAPGADKIYNGADDDASGCIAVLELARVLARGQRPKRTVYFAFFGSEEAGGFGAQYFVNNLPFPKDSLVANLEFEMIGRPDKKVKPDELWLTGYERSNLGSEFARRGAKLVRDPHPEQNFFQRSDNYTLARQGIIAHTVSSFGLHKDYHQPSDEIKTIDFSHITRAINSMVAPVRWLVNSNFKPQWNAGQKP
ncbi:MAG: M20/M25/M40 family metallo-hydrolase [Pyrinomonadaceae bacterium]